MRWPLAFMAMGLLGCSGSPAMRVERRAVGPVAGAPKPLRGPEQLPRATSEHAGTLEMARDLMRGALERTRGQVACLRRL